MNRLDLNLKGDSNYGNLVLYFLENYNQMRRDFSIINPFDKTDIEMYIRIGAKRDFIRDAVKDELK